MNRFYIDPESYQENEITITGEDFKHLSKVLRLKPGDQVECYDGKDHKAIGTIKEIGTTGAVLELSDKGESGRENQVAEITLFQGFPKQNKLEAIVQKNTELGVKTIIPFYAKRSVPKPSKSESKKTVRLNRVAYEASKQCGRGVILSVESPQTFDHVLDSLSDFDLILVPYENEKTTSLKSVLDKVSKDKKIRIALIIGPEGGFDPEEIELLSAKGAKSVSLGPRILRTETAGMAAVSQINYALEDYE